MKARRKIFFMPAWLSSFVDAVPEELGYRVLWMLDERIGKAGGSAMPVRKEA